MNIKERFESFVDLFDVPSGSILGLFTLVMIGVCVHAYAKHVELPTSVVDVYKYVVMSFAGSKAVKTIWGKAVPDDAPKQ